MKRHNRILSRLFLVCFLVLLLFGSVEADIFGETVAPAEVDLDFSPFSGTVLLNRLTEVQADPDAYAGLVIRVRGQYYAAMDADGNLRRSLIVCDSCQCAEIGIQLSCDEESGIIWPEINSSIEIIGVVEPYITSAETLSARLAVLDVH